MQYCAAGRAIAPLQVVRNLCRTTPCIQYRCSSVASPDADLRRQRAEWKISGKLELNIMIGGVSSGRRSLVQAGDRCDD